ncbi:hypothetical protein BC938DRAFT_479666 [Jimgerdemannia flammicorona]|uniref:F-box domain-containing protein n=1 Tax=Jimgerdemannia flammicorona TaxID=994334 RepID=A0A433QXN1_9FUNG|nr:hypothetical protein BC938DRAFT_479666 [Jimgerdemannia flammicorona]
MEASITTVPQEVLDQIFSLLELPDLTRLSTTCKTLHLCVTDSQVIWHDRLLPPRAPPQTSHRRVWAGASSFPEPRRVRCPPLQ